MGREKRSRIRRGHGCLTGCLGRLLFLLGLAAVLFVGAHMSGFVATEPGTGRPLIGTGGNSGGAGGGIALPAWEYSVGRDGLTMKALRGGGRQSLLLCCDGYTALIGGGAGSYGTTLQLLLCGVTRLDAAILLSDWDGESAGLLSAAGFAHPGYLFYADKAAPGSALERLESAAETAQAVRIVPGMSFNLGRGRVTFLSLNDGTAGVPYLRIEYGNRSIVVAGDTEERKGTAYETPGLADADLLICHEGGAGAEAVFRAAGPSAAVCTGMPDWRIKQAVSETGAALYSASQDGVITIRSDGETVTVTP